MRSGAFRMVGPAETAHSAGPNTQTKEVDLADAARDDTTDSSRV
jgi:hypothetical protein